MSETETSQRTRVTESFLNWVNRAVEAGIPVIVKKRELEELSPTLQNLVPSFKFLGLSEQDIMNLAKSGEAAAKFEKAKIEKADREKLARLRQDYQRLWVDFAADRTRLSEKFGLNEEEMLALFQKLTQTP